MSGGRTNVFAPRVRNTYPSKRLQQVVQRFKTSVAKIEGSATTGAMVFPDAEKSSSAGESDDSGDEELNDKKRKAKAAKSKGGPSKKKAKPSAVNEERVNGEGTIGDLAETKTTRGRGRGKGRGTRGSARGITTGRGKGRGGSATS